MASQTYTLTKHTSRKEGLRYELRNQTELLAIWTCERAKKRRIPWFIRIFLFFFWIILWLAGLLVGGEMEIPIGSGQSRPIHFGKLQFQEQARTYLFEKNQIREPEHAVGELKKIKRFKAFQAGRPYQLILQGEKAAELEPIFQWGKSMYYHVCSEGKQLAKAHWSKKGKDKQLLISDLAPTADLKVILFAVWPLLRGW